MATGDKLVTLDGLKAAYDNLNSFKMTDPSRLTWVVGKSLNASTSSLGKLTNNTNYVTCSAFVWAKAGSTIGLTDYTNFKFQVARYTLNDGATAGSTDESDYTCTYLKSANSSNSLYTVPSDCYVRFSVRPATDAAQSNDSLKQNLLLNIIQDDTLNNIVNGLVAQANASTTGLATVETILPTLAELGMGQSKALESATDLDTVKTAGVYFATNAVATTLTNCPVPVHFRMFVMNGSATTNIMQILIDRGNNRIWTRGATGSIWTEWARLATGKELTDAVAKLPEAPSEDGVYSLKVTVVDGTPTYSWESDA